jgi:HicB family
MSRKGRLTVRIPASLHDELVNAARQEAVTLNQFICASLAGAVGWRAGKDEPETYDRDDDPRWRAWDLP